MSVDERCPLGVCPTMASVNASLGNDSKRGVVIA